MTAATRRSEQRVPSRALRRGDFRRVVQHGRRVGGKRLSVYAITRDDEVVRAGVTVRRGVGGSVERNRARRVVREAWRSLEGRVRGGVELVLVAGPGSQRVKVQDVEEELEALLLESGVID